MPETQPRKLVRSRYRGPYYRYEDADTGETVLDIHLDLATPTWRYSTPSYTFPTFPGIGSATREANRYLRRRGYQEISTPSP